MSNIKTELTIGDRIKKARKERGLSQKELGEALQLSDKAISSYEVGRAMPNIDVIKEIGRLTYKPIQYFIEDNDPDDLDLQMKLNSIERELLEIKQLLRQQQITGSDLGDNDK